MTATAHPNTANDLASKLNSVQKFISSHQFENADQQLGSILTESPDNLDALYLAVVSSRYQQRFEDAQNYLQRLFKLNLEHGRAHQEQGYLLSTQGLFSQALAAFERATQINPALEASWREQAKLCKQLNLPERAQQPLAQLQRLSQLPKPVIAVTDLLAQGKLAKAENLCRGILERQPRNTEAMRLLANIGSRMGAMSESEILLENACRFEPDNYQVRIDYIQLLRRRQKFSEAFDQSKVLLESNPENPQFQSIFAIEALQTGDYDTALDYFNRVLQQIPNDTNTLTSRGHALKTAGRTDEAIPDYQLAAQYAHCEAYYSLSNLKTYRFSETEIERMQSLEPNTSLGLMDRVYLNFALGKAFEDSSQFEQAFSHYQEGNRLKQQQSGYSSDKMQEEFENQKHFFTHDQVSRLTGCGDNAADPIFILGLPRAGSTMLEQILASHSQIDGTLELPNILAMSQELRRTQIDETEPGYPSVIGHLSAIQLQAFGQRYIEETRIHREAAPFFIDKMPNNFRHIGLIKTILPNAKIIDIRRHPMDCCWSNFKQLFAEGQEFTYSQEDIGRYYAGYVELMNHWHEVFPNQILQVNYEDLVEDLEPQVQKILDYCKLPFEPTCLAFHTNKRAVRTASSEQVRQPINRKGMDRWQAFESNLTPLKNALGTSLTSYRDTPNTLDTSNTTTL